LVDLLGIDGQAEQHADPVAGVGPVIGQGLAGPVAGDENAAPADAERGPLVYPAFAGTGTELAVRLLGLHSVEQPVGATVRAGRNPQLVPEPFQVGTLRVGGDGVTLTDGTALSPALGIGAFAEKTLVHAGQCTKVDPGAPPAVAGLLGCGVMAGLGAAINTGGVTRGDSVAVFGCGGVGDAAIMGSRLAGAHTVIAVDIDDRKLDWARNLGATHTIDSSQTDPVEAIRDLTGGFGVDVAIEAVGRPETYEQAFYARDLAGTVVLVGVPNPTMVLELPMIEVFGRGGALKSSWYGDCLPTRDFPMLIDLYLQGRLDLDAFVSETIPLDGVEAAFDKMHRGEVLRSVVMF
jgi:S-(hydroxymethyl)mycothiol dehydrogenase